MSRLVPAEDLEDVEAWDVPDVSDPKPETAVTADHPRTLITASALESIQRKAYQEAWQQGHREGLTQGHREALEETRARLGERIALVEDILNTLQSPLADLDRQVEHELTELALVLARQVVRREVRADPGQIVAVVREAVGALPAGVRNVRVHVHPDDAEFLRQVLTIEEEETSWRLETDPVMSRGGCRISSDTSSIDATVEHRLSSIVATILGGERKGDGI